MPELPEVETIRQRLRRGTEGQPSLLGMHLLGAEVSWPRTLATSVPEEFNERISGQALVEVGRRGKFLIFHLDRDALLIHLRMSGDLQIGESDIPPPDYERLALVLDTGLRLSFTDARKFGRVWLVSDPQEVVGGLGPEPLEDGFTGEALAEMLAGRKSRLKPLLLDQSFLAGLGNIYTDEALNRARLHPLMSAGQVSAGQAQQLRDSIRAVLEEGILRNGASLDWVYRGGDFQNYFRVYQRTGLGCPECGTPIERIVVGQRGTHFCPTCQRV